MRVMSEEEEETDGKVRSPEGPKGWKDLEGEGEEVEFDAPGEEGPQGTTSHRRRGDTPPPAVWPIPTLMSIHSHRFSGEGDYSAAAASGRTHLAIQTSLWPQEWRRA